MEEVKNVSKRPMVVVISLCLAVVVSLGLAGYFYQQNLQLKKTPGILGEERANQVLAELSQIIVVPTDEKPTVAEVTDPTLLKDHPFLAKAQKGDFVIIYAIAAKAYLYDAIAHKIIDVGSVTNEAPTPENSVSEVPATAE